MKPKRINKVDAGDNTEAVAEVDVSDAAVLTNPASSAEAVINEYLNAAKTETEAKIDAILEDARAQADKIISDAKDEAVEIHKEARLEGFDEGKAEGIEEGKRSYDLKLAEKIREDDDALKKVLDEIYQERERIYSELEEETVNLTLDIVRKIINPAEEILGDVFLSQIKNALRQMTAEEKVVIRVGASEYERFFSSGAATIELDSGITVNASVLRDVALNEGDLIIDTNEVTINAGLESQLQYVKIAFERANQYEPD